MPFLCEQNYRGYKLALESHKKETSDSNSAEHWANPVVLFSFCWIRDEVHRLYSRCIATGSQLATATKKGCSSTLGNVVYCSVPVKSSQLALKTKD